MVPLSGFPLFSISQGLRIVAYTAPSINHTPRRGRAFPFADASADQGRGPAAGRADRALAGIGQDREGHRAGRGVTCERVRPRSRCLLFGVEQTSWWRTATSQFDPSLELCLQAMGIAALHPSYGLRTKRRRRVTPTPPSLYRAMAERVSPVLPLACRDTRRRATGSRP